MQQQESDNDDFYQTLRKRLNKWVGSDAGKNNPYTGYILVAPDLLHLLCKLTLEKEIPVAQKAKLALCIAYFISPIDLLPEAVLGVAGLVDDVALTAWVLNGIINEVDPEIVKKHWAGDGDILEIIKEIIKVADEMVGSGLWNKMKDMFSTKKS